jgi:hypothetical protein
VSDIDRLLRWFEEGALVRPAADAPNSVDLSLALASLAGAPDVQLTRSAAAIAKAIGPAEHYIFVLVDGLGMNLLESAPESFIGSHVAMELQPVFPSTTAAALASLATGRWPAEHAAVAWWTHLPEAGLTATIMPFVERYSGRPLQEFGVTPESVFPHGSRLAVYSRDVRSFLPANIASGAFSSFASGGTPIDGYTTFAEGVDMVVRRIEAARGPTYTYLYTPSVDAAEHRSGPGSAEVAAQLAEKDAQVARLAAALDGRARIALSSDHGVMEVPDSGRNILRKGDALLELLDVPPSGEPRVPFFHVREGWGERFEAAFRERYGDRFALLTVDEAERLELFGPGKLSSTARARIGTHIGITAEAAVLVYEPAAWLRGYHGGLARAEMRVPLAIV